jgi:DNA-binding IclR family transcriptional regulator
MNNLDTPLKRAVGVLSLVSEHPDGLTRAEIGRALDLPRPTAHRMTRTLEELGLIRAIGNGRRFGLGPSLIRWGFAALEALDLPAVAHPHLVHLVAETSETAHLGMRDGSTVVYLDRVDSPQPVRMASRLGGAMPSHSTALGKALLAAADPNEWESHLQTPLEARTPRTITDREELRQEIARCRARGFALDLEENELGVVCAAAVVRDHRGEPIAAVSVSVPKFRLQGIDSLAASVRSAAADISRELGFADTAEALQATAG